MSGGLRPVTGMVGKGVQAYPIYQNADHKNRPAIRAGSYGLITFTLAPEWGLLHFDRSRSLLALACFMC
jgi:hypothetical protein